MRILYCLEPFLDLAQPYVMASWLMRFQRMHEQLQAFGDNYEGRLLTWEAYDHSWQGYFLDERITLTHAELRLDWKARGALYERFEWGSASPDEVAGIQALLRKRLSGFAPDIVILLSASAWLKPVLPDALFLHAEATWLHAPPHFDLWQLDPAGFGKGRALADRCEDSLRELAWDDGKAAFCAHVRNIAGRLWPASDALLEEIAKLRSRYRRLILLPLGEYAPTDGETPMMSILDWYLGQASDKDAYLVTQHPHAPALVGNQTSYLTSKYPHLVVSANFSTAPLFPLVDAVLGDFTSASSQTLLFDKEVVALGEDCPFRTPRFDVRSPLSSWIAGADAEQRDRMLYWLLTRYSIPQDRLVNGLWLSGFLRRALSAFRSGESWRVFEAPICDQAEWEGKAWFQEGTEQSEPVVDEATRAAEARILDDRRSYEEAAQVMACGSREAALSALKALVAESTPLWNPYNDLGVIVAESGEWRRAEELLRAALRLDAEAGPPRLNLVAVKLAQGEFEAALAELGPLMRKEPANPEIFNLARDIVGQAPALSTLSWIRLVADIRAGAFSKAKQ